MSHDFILTDDDAPAGATHAQDVLELPTLTMKQGGRRPTLHSCAGRPPDQRVSGLKRLPAAMGDSRNDLAIRIAVDCDQERRRDKTTEFISGREQQSGEDVYRVPAHDPKGRQNDNGNYPKPGGVFRP